MKKTIKQLEKENSILEAEVQRLKDEDRRIREVLSNLLDSEEFEQESWSGNMKRKLVVQPWEGIAFLIGELKSDADYSLAIERERMLKGEIMDLKSKIKFLESGEEPAEEVRL